ncbi:MAG: Fic family protein [Candidatus Thorarchaeota archaeon]|nr:Fic family protein [Candidatus Thorarchaeota archaeon]
MTIDYYNYYEFKPGGYPVKHRRKEPFIPMINVGTAYRDRINEIRRFDFEFDRFILSADDYGKLIEDAYASNVHWSTKLEGNPLTEQETAKITSDTFSGTLIRERPFGPFQEIVNHLIHGIFPEISSFPWTHEKIEFLNFILLWNTGANTKMGEYRKNHCSVKTSTGMEIFIPAPPEHVREEMGFLLDWVNHQAPAYDPIAGATVFFHEFESVHPFEDGNGRTGRSLFHLLLQELGLRNSNLCKIDCYILKDSELYYQLLAYADYTGSYAELIDFFSYSILKSYEDAQKRLSQMDLINSGLDEISLRILRKSKERQKWFTLKEATEWVGEVGDQTVRSRLNELVEMSVLERIGQTRATRYRLRDPLDEIRREVLEIAYENSPEELMEKIKGITPYRE